MSRSQEQPSLSFPFSDILSEADHQELLKQVPINSEEMHAILEQQSFFPIDDAFPVEEYKEDFSQIHIPVAQQQFPHAEKIISHSNSNVLSNEEYSGPFDFEVMVIPNHKSKNPWVYSSVLNKVFMDMGHQFPVDFKIKDRPNKFLYIRITPQYSLPQYAQEPVHRCITHEHPMDSTNKGIPDHVRSHVIRCSNSGCQYMGNKENNERLSIVLPFSQPQIGSESVREMFLFVCKSSCASPGMNRRAIEVIFTLENEVGEVFGRKCLNVRICACPKRDKEKEEKEYHKDKYNSVPKGKKRKIEANPSSGKVIMNNDTDTKEYSVNLKVVGKQNLLKILNYAEDLIEAQCYRHQNGANGDLPFKKNLLDIQALKNNIN